MKNFSVHAPWLRKLGLLGPKADFSRSRIDFGAHFEASREHFDSLESESGIILGTFLATACFKKKLEAEGRATQTLWAKA